MAQTQTLGLFRESGVERGTELDWRPPGSLTLGSLKIFYLVFFFTPNIIRSFERGS